MPALADLTRQAIRTHQPGEVRPYPEAAGQTFVAGDFVTIDSSGLISIAATAGNVLQNTGDNLVGVAVEKASGTTNNLIQVATIGPETVYDLPSDAATALTDVGVQCTLRNDTDGGWMADIGDTGNPVLRCIDVSRFYDGDKQAVGVSRGALMMKPIPSEVISR